MKIEDLVVYNIPTRRYTKIIYKIIQVKDFIVYIEHPETHHVYEEAKCNLSLATEDEIAAWVTDKLTGESIV